MRARPGVSYARTAGPCPGRDPGKPAARRTLKRYRAGSTSAPSGGQRPYLLPPDLLVVGFERVLLVFLGVPLDRVLAPRVISHLEALDQLVAAVLVDRGLVGEEHPFVALEVLHVEDLMVEIGGVVDDQQHLGLGVEVGPRTDRQLVELERAVVSGHVCRVYTRPRARVLGS